MIGWECYGNIDPFEHGVMHKREQKQLCSYIYRHEDALIAGLSDTQKETLEKLQDSTPELHRLEELEMFTVGFQFGVRIMVECTGRKCKQTVKAKRLRLRMP